MSALHDLERTLARAVADGAAAPAPAVAPARRRRVRLPRRPWHIAVAILLAGGVTTGSLAASGVLHVEKAESFHFPIYPSIDTGKPNSPLRILPLRVADPDGGPPWVIRTFTTTRKAACAQAGQLYRGQFGAVEYDEHRRKIFRLRGTSVPGYDIQCSSLGTGLPVFAGFQDMRVLQRNPTCNRGWRLTGPCQIVGERILRFGMLGPKATSATFIRPDGTKTAPHAIPTGIGGAYLFVENVDPSPLIHLTQFQASLRAQVDRRYPRRPRSSMSQAEWQAQNRLQSPRSRFYQRVYRRHRAEFKALSRAAYESDGIDATFDGGTTLRVAGAGLAGNGPEAVLPPTQLPGVAPSNQDLPASTAAPITGRYRGRRRALEVSFPAPVAIDRFSRSYAVTVVGPIGPTCSPRSQSTTVVVYKAPKVGGIVRARLLPALVLVDGNMAMVRSPAHREGRRAYAWCPGRTYTARVEFIAGPFKAPSLKRFVGQTTFVAR